MGHRQVCVLPGVSPPNILMQRALPGMSPLAPLAMGPSVGHMGSSTVRIRTFCTIMCRAIYSRNTQRPTSNVQAATSLSRARARRKPPRAEIGKPMRLNLASNLDRRFNEHASFSLARMGDMSLKYMDMCHVMCISTSRTADSPGARPGHRLQVVRSA